MAIETIRTRSGLVLTRRLSEAIVRADRETYSFFSYYARPDDRGNYLDISTKGEISWRPEARILRDAQGFPLADEFQFAIKGRQVGRPARVLKSFLKTTPYGLEDYHWEIFSNRFLADVDDTTKIKIVRGEDVRYYYHEDRLTKKRHVRELRNSCMRHASTQDYLDLYAENPKQVGMLVEFDSDGLVNARALVWNTDRNVTVLDRVYGDNNSRELLRKYAVDNGWWYRAVNGYGSPSKMVVDGEARSRTLRVTLENKPVSFYPWLDTFLWYDVEGGVLANTKGALRGREHLVQLRRTDGGYVTPRARRSYW